MKILSYRRRVRSLAFLAKQNWRLKKRRGLLHISRLGHNSGEGKELLNLKDNAETRTNGYKQTINKCRLVIRRVCLNILRAGLQIAFPGEQAGEGAHPDGKESPRWQPGALGRGMDPNPAPYLSLLGHVNWLQHFILCTPPPGEGRG